MDEIEKALLKQRIQELEASMNYSRSKTIQLFLDLKVMLENEEYVEALEMVTTLTDN